MKSSYIIPHYAHPSAPLGFLQMALVVGQDLVHKLSRESPYISYVFQTHSFMLPLDYHLWSCLALDLPVSQTLPPFFDREAPLVPAINFYSFAWPEHPGTKLLLLECYRKNAATFLYFVVACGTRIYVASNEARR